MRLVAMLVLIFLSWTGWGAVAGRLLGLRLVWPEKAVLGVSVMLILGGVLNHQALISPLIVHQLVAGGAVLWILQLWTLSRPVAHPLCYGDRPDRWAGILASVMLVCLALFAASTLTMTGIYNDHDDYPAYAAFAQKMLQTGQMGYEPFSERRIASALGGKYWLDTWSLTLLGDGRTLALDIGVGALLFAALLSLWGTRLGLGQRRALVVCVAAGPFLILCSNTTAWALPAAMGLWVAMRLDPRLWPDGEGGPGRWVALGAVLAAIASLKSNLIPPWAIAVALSALLALRRGQRSEAAGMAAAALLAVVFVLPWAAAQARDCGTWLFPILGRGYHVSAYGSGAAGRWELSAPLLKIIALDLVDNKFLLLTILAALLAALCRIRPARITAVLASCALAAALALSVATAGWFNFHYTYSIFVVALAAVLVEGARAWDRAPRRRMLISTVLFVAVLAGSLARIKPLYGWFETVYVAVRAPGLFGPALQRIPLHEWSRRTMNRVQRRTPPGSTILASSDTAAAMDFRRNRVLLADFPGQASPPPGMPLDGGYERWAEYLRGQGVRYVLMDRSGVYTRKGLEFIYNWRAFEGRLWIVRQMGDALKYLDLFERACEELPCDRSDHLWLLDLGRRG
ncbi:MAG: hypothetical protein MOGMAGMI_01444 [Candidatus Omnitrophica bacterium]|nr:hypothetical protein [Candidatus Omnitrophota bacterium]